MSPMEIDLAIRAAFPDGYVGVKILAGSKDSCHIVDSVKLAELIDQRDKLLASANTCICAWCGLIGDKDPERIMRHSGECTARQDGYELQKRADDAKINAAVSIALRYGGIDGGHHKQWVIDQMLRAILGDIPYVKAVEEYNSDCMDYERWDEGTAP